MPAHRFGETAHHAVLDGREVVHRAKVDPPSGAARPTSTVGGRNPARSTAVGTPLPTHRLPTRDDVVAWVGAAGLDRRTPRTRRTADEPHRNLARVRERGCTTDDGENEPGVTCLALPVPAGSPTAPSGASSVSAVACRTPLRPLVDAVAEIRDALGDLGGTR
ncbi:IclR family transcriptional regulator C-terminal domain-containing protein [Actinosynnema sp. NPDC053489]|uniref:IclR family transcriptional regulator domain-containing protein n=1 Tax=Actinosynnema sp. NPDC053489 TaxID=3363916 RepID=UPI0037C52E87